MLGDHPLVDVDRGEVIESVQGFWPEM